MTSKARSKQELLLEVADLRLRLAEAEDILRAIREYEVDALVVKAGHGDQVFALESADHAYRQMVEQMREGAATLTVDGVVLYANQQLARLMQCPPARLLGEHFANCLLPVDHSRVAALLAAPEGGRVAAHIQALDGGRVPVSLSASRLHIEDRPVVLLLVTDLTYEKQADRVARLLQLSTRLATAVTGTQVAEAVISRLPR
jgi:PAS domain S-box-containing protein